jgi:serine protease Do
VSKGGPAEKAGLEAGDVIIEVDGRAIDEPPDLSGHVASREPGTPARLRILRDGEERQLTVSLGTFPEEGSEEARPARLGMTLRELTPGVAERLALPLDARGLVVTDVEAGGPAEEAGLQPRDQILSVNGQAVSTVAEFESAVESVRKTGLARLRVRRDSSVLFVVLELS